MGNYYACSKLVEKGLSDKYDVEDIVTQIEQIPSKVKNTEDSVRVTALRNASHDEIKNCLLIGRNITKKHLSETYNDNIEQINTDMGSQNVSDGGDLLYKDKAIIEVKAGKECTRNLGLQYQDKILGTTILTERLNGDFNTRQIENFKRIGINGYTLNDFEKDTYTYLDDIVIELNKLIESNNKLSKENANYLENNFLNVSGVYDENNHKDYIKIKLLGLNKWVITDPFPVGIGEWIILPIKRINGKIKRITIKYYNPTTKLLISNQINCKNNDDDNNIPSKYYPKTISCNTVVTIKKK